MTESYNDDVIKHDVTMGLSINSTKSNVVGFWSVYRRPHNVRNIPVSPSSFSKSFVGYNDIVC